MNILRKSFSLFLVLGLISTACGGSDSDDSSSSSSSSAATATTAAPAATTAAPAAPASSGSSLGDGSLGTVEVDAGEDIQIRSLHAISGDVAFLGVPMSRAVDMAVADYGDIHGHSVNVGTWLDDLCSSDGGQAAAQTIVADESVVGVLGTSCSGAATAAAPLITGAGMVLISGSNTSPALTSDLAGTAGDNWSEGYYRTAHNDLYQGAAAAKFAYEVLGATTAATIHDGDPYTEGLATAFANSFTELGGDLQTITAVNKGDTDMVPVLTEVAAGSPDLLFFPIFPPEGNFISQQVGEVAGLENTTLMAADGMLVDNYMEIPESEGVFMSGPDLNFEGNANAATGQTGDGFLAAYEAEHGEAPSAAFWAHAYDATTLLLSAIEAASSKDGDTLVVDRAGVREFMSGVSSWPGIIGDISCDDFGDCGSQRIAVVQHNDSSDIAAGKDNVVFTYAPGKSAVTGALSSAEAMCVGLVTDVGQVDDKSFNQSAWEGVLRAADELGADVDYIETQAAKDYATNIGLFADNGCDVIVTVGFALGEATAIAAAEYPDVDFVGVDQFQGAAVDGVAGLIFPEDQAGFLAGALAASMSQSGIIAEVLGTDLVPPVVAFGEGYVNGAKYVNPSIKVIKTYHPGGIDTAFTDPEWGATTARQALENGADVVFGAGGKTGNGALIEVAGEEGALCIGVDSDQWFTVPEAHPCLITSSMKMITDGVFDLISQSAAGSMPSGNYGGAVGLAPFHDFDSMVSDDIKSMLATLKADLESGAMSPCVWDADSNPDCAKPEPLTASWRGVTEDAIHVGVSMLDFAFLVETNLSPQGWGDQQLVWETFVEKLNNDGGILGRDLIVDEYKYYSPIGPILGGIDPEAVCLELAADIETFAVLGGFLGPVEDINTCITGTQNTIMVGGRQTAERLAASTAPWIEPGTMKETKMKVFLSLLEQEGLLEGKNIALVGNEDDGPYNLASDLLSDMDANVVLDVGVQVPVGDTAAEDARWDVLVQNVLASGADVAVLVGGERAGIRNLANNDIDMDLYVMNSETFTNLSESVTPEMAEGAVSLTGLTEQEIWDDPLTQNNCVIPFKEANPDLVIEGPDQFDEGEEEWYRSIMSYCRWLHLFTMIAEAAGPNLTHDSFLAAAESMSDFVLPGQPYNSISPGKYDASDSFRLSVFDSASGGDQGALVPLTGILDGTP